MKGNIFSPWLVTLRKPVGLASKAIPIHQFYMSHPQYREKVTEEYRARYPSGIVGPNAIKDRNNMAIELLQKEPKDI
jgi:hypothetical protein